MWWCNCDVNIFLFYSRNRTKTCIHVPIFFSEHTVHHRYFKYRFAMDSVFKFLILFKYFHIYIHTYIYIFPICSTLFCRCEHQWCHCCHCGGSFTTSGQMSAKKILFFFFLLPLFFPQRAQHLQSTLFLRFSLFFFKVQIWNLLRIEILLNNLWIVIQEARPHLHHHFFRVY